MDSKSESNLSVNALMCFLLLALVSSQSINYSNLLLTRDMTAIVAIDLLFERRVVREVFGQRCDSDVSQAHRFHHLCYILSLEYRCKPSIKLARRYLESSTNKYKTCRIG